jgi:hypothetical protein
VGFSLAASVPQFQGAVPGDFKVVIPWATGDSRFMIVSAPVNNMAGGDDTVGVVEKVGTECPAASPP